MQVSVGGMVFFDGSGAGDSVYLLTKISGWFDGTETRRDKTPRPQQHGSFASQGYQSGRTIALEMEVYTDTKEQQREALSTLAALLADGGYSTLTVEEDATVWSISVGRDGEPSVNLDLYGRLASVRMQFWAPDPLWWAAGTWEETAHPTAGDGVVWPLVWPLVWPGGGNPGRISLVNSGKAPSSPVFQLVGGMGSAVITCVDTGARIGFERAIPVGQTVEIDVASRRATQGGNDVSRWLRYREWQDVPAGATRRYQLAVTSPSGSPLLRGKVDSAWW